MKIKKGTHFKTICNLVKSDYLDEIDPVYKNVKRPKWMKENNVIYDFKVVMGNYYEVLTRALYGGRFGQDPFFNFQNFFDVGNLNVGLDVVDLEKKEVYESKSWRSGMQENILDNQQFNYINLQTKNPEFQFYHIFYLHGFKEILYLFEGFENDLFNSLREKTLSSIALPLSIISELHASNNKDLIYRYNQNKGSKFQSCTCVKPFVSKALLLDPEEFIDKYLDREVNDFIIEKKISPNELRFEGKKVLQFPVLKIKDKDHDKWLREKFVPF